MNETSEGIVLFQQKYKENDALVKIFTETYGTKMFFVKSLNKPNHHLASYLIPTTMHNYVMDIHNPGLSFIKEADAQHFFRHIQDDIYLSAYASYISQLVDAAIDDNEVDKALYQLLKECLSALNDGIPPEIVTIYLELRLLPRFGIYFNWAKCLYCENHFGPFQVSLIKQGLLCPHHLSEDKHHLRSSANAVHVLRQLSSVTMSQIKSVKLNQDIYNELREMMDDLYSEYVGIRLKAKSYLDQLLKSERLFESYWKKA